jgi:hypothetical protein
MTSDAAEFDEGRATSYRPRRVEKTAILVVPARVPVEITARFGTQVMHGPFYVVADDDSSYGAAQREFEATHEQLAPTTWVKSEPVLAYRLDRAASVGTLIDGRRESTVDAQPGQWLVRQATGEVMVVDPDAFDQRYELADADG